MIEIWWRRNWVWESKNLYFISDKLLEKNVHIFQINQSEFIWQLSNPTGPSSLMWFMRTSLSNKVKSTWRIASHPAVFNCIFQAKPGIRKKHNGFKNSKSERRDGTNSIWRQNILLKLLSSSMTLHFLLMQVLIQMLVYTIIQRGSWQHWVV